MSTPSPISSHSGDMQHASAGGMNMNSNMNSNMNAMNTPPLGAEKPAPFPVEAQKPTGLFKWNPFKVCSLPLKTGNPYVTTMIACMGGIIFGFASTNLTPFIGKPAYTDYFGKFTPIDQSGMTAAMPGGSLLGAILSVFIADSMGRRSMLQLSAVFFVIGSAIQTSAINRESLAFGRIIASIGIGTTSSNVPLYLAEMVPPEKRGGFGSCFQLSVNLGILAMFYIGFGCHFIKGPAGFRLAWGIQMIPGAIMFVGSLFLHESPRWLASKGLWDECVNVLTAIHKCDAENPIIVEEIELFQSDLEIKPGNFLDLFKKKNIKQTACAFICMLTQQYCGTNAILYFSTSITSQVGYTGNMNDIMGSIDYIVLLAATIPSVLFLDKWSRRHNMLFGSIMLVITMAVVAGVEATRGRAVGPEGLNGDPSVRWTVDSKPAANAALAFSYIFLGFFSLSWGPIAWVYVGEIFNHEVRSVGNAFGSIVNWLFNFTLTIYTQTAFQNITWKTYVIFAVFAFISIPLVFFLFPETKGYELEQVSTLFESDVPAWKTDSWYLAFMKLRNKKVDLPEAPSKSEMNGTAMHEEHADVMN